MNMEKKTLVGWMAFLNVRSANQQINDNASKDGNLYTEEEFNKLVPYDTHVPLYVEDPKEAIKNDVDRLAEVRGIIKELQAEEKTLKNKMLDDGRKEIPGNNFRVVITERSAETFNEEAFIEAFSKDNSFDKKLKAKILTSKVIIDQKELLEACQKEIISLDYVKPFNEIKTSKVVGIK